MSQHSLHGNQPSVVGATERVSPVIWIFFQKSITYLPHRRGFSGTIIALFTVKRWKDVSSERWLVEGWMNQEIKKYHSKKRKKEVSKRENKWTTYIMEKEKTNERIKKEGRVRFTEKKWPRKGEIKEENK